MRCTEVGCHHVCQSHERQRDLSLNTAIIRHLIRYDAMCRAIADAYEADEVKQIRDKPRAIEMYARQARNVEAERRACEIRLRAERRCGQLLREMQKAKAGRPPENRGRIRPACSALACFNEPPDSRETYVS